MSQADAPHANNKPAATSQGAAKSKSLLGKLNAGAMRQRAATWFGSTRGRLLAAGIAVVVLGAGYFYLTAGRYVSTDNAYVKATKVMVASEVPGVINQVAIKENQHVESGAVLFRLDDRSYRFALAQAEARLGTMRAEIEGLKASYLQKQEELALAKENLSFARTELDRQTRLAAHDAVSQSKFDSARHDVEVTTRRIAIAEQDLAQIRAQLNDRPDMRIEDYPRYIDAAATRDKAALDLEHTTIRAPFSGIASNVPVIGQQVSGNSALSMPVMSIVRDSEMWIEANFKETDIARVKPGQHVTIDVDTYSGRTLRGTVTSISQATGAEFSVIPPQNATGNWVKVVQRIPIRISVDDTQGTLLRAGLSTNVEIDTGRYPRLPSFAQNLGGAAEAAEARTPQDK